MAIKQCQLPQILLEFQGVVHPLVFGETGMMVPQHEEIQFLKCASSTYYQSHRGESIPSQKKHMFLIAILSSYKISPCKNGILIQGLASMDLVR